MISKDAAFAITGWVPRAGRRGGFPGNEQLGTSKWRGGAVSRQSVHRIFKRFSANSARRL